ncbi:MAG: bifunctional adenosylcobinamide kinase/adenosylcobinamide-phosphate guanylyltransferase [Thermodesulfovibrionales bacterium]
MDGKKIIFITGGARSGKSRFALKLASAISSIRKAYIATAEALDGEMKERIEDHKRQRGDEWVTYEEPLSIANVLEEIEGRYSVILIDCLTLWLSNLMHAGLNIEIEIEHFISSLVTCHSSPIYIVSNEVGMGIVPENEMARRFRDMAGFLNQKIAEVADEVYMVVAGIPVKIKDKGEI